MCWQSDAQSNFPPQPTLGRDDEKARVFGNANDRSWPFTTIGADAATRSLSGRSGRGPSSILANRDANDPKRSFKASHGPRQKC